MNGRSNESDNPFCAEIRIKGHKFSSLHFHFYTYKILFRLIAEQQMKSAFEIKDNLLHFRKLILMNTHAVCWFFIMITRLCYFDTLKPRFFIVQFEFSGKYIISSYFCSKA